MASPTFLERLDNLAERCGDRCHPIVVREVRQALQSHWTVFAFLLLIFVCWIISMLGLLTGGEDMSLNEGGPRFFELYYVALCFALCIIVPAMLFQNVVAEFDGQTFEMLAITTLKPRSIVFGKLKSASVQMGAFFSAVAPFVCFTYLLGGLSIPSIIVAMLIAYIGGLSSCMGAMMFGSLGKQSGWRIVCLLISMILGCILFGISSGFGKAVSQESIGIDSLGGLCGGAACFGYSFGFYALFTIGVTIVQFTPTIPYAGARARSLRSSRAGKRTESKPGVKEKRSTGASGSWSDQWTPSHDVPDDAEDADEADDATQFDEVDWDNGDADQPPPKAST